MSCSAKRCWRVTLEAAAGRENSLQKALCVKSSEYRQAAIPMHAQLKLRSRRSQSILRFEADSRRDDGGEDSPGQAMCGLQVQAVSC
jgi:hypothetical protein